MKEPADADREALARYAPLARQILDLAEAEGWSEGQRLTEPALAERLAVSRTPVRKALELMLVCGLVRREEQRLVLAGEPGTPSLDRARLPGSSIDALAQTILAERFAGLLGEQVSVAELVGRYAISRVLAQDILEKMREEGLIERAEGHTWLFKAGLIDRASFEESTRFRMLLEPAALLEPNFSINPRRLAALRRQHQEMLATETSAERAGSTPAARIADLDAAFHDAIAADCGNRFLAQAIRQHNNMRRIGEYSRYALKGALAETLREQLGVLEAIAAGEMELAASRLREHLERSLARAPDVDKARALAFRRLTRR